MHKVWYAVTNTSRNLPVHSQSSIKRNNCVLKEMLELTTTVNTASITHECTSCHEVFPSRNKLFRHIKYDHEDELLNNEISHAKRKLDCNDEQTRKEIPTDKHTNDTKTDNSSNKNDDKNISNNILRHMIKIIQEDDTWYRIILKPQGLPTMGDTSVETLQNSDQMLLPDALKNHVKYKKAVACHRLDSATGGLVLCSKSIEAEASIKASFRDREVYKRYRAIVIGRLEPAVGVIDTPLSGQPAVTKYQVVSYTKSFQYTWITTVDVWPHTGRRHQLRKHLKEIGHSIINDPKYCVANEWCSAPGFNGKMFLWALELRFPHKGMKDIQSSGSRTLHDTSANQSTESISDSSNNTNKHSADGALSSTALSSSSLEEDIYHDTDRLLGYPLIKVSIDEPDLYEEFRQYQASTCP